MTSSTAEAEIAPFIKTANTPDTLLLSPEAAQEAGAAFTTLCDDEFLANADFVDLSEYPIGYPHAVLQKTRVFPDGSNIRASISSRALRLPEDHPDKKFARDNLYGIRVRSWAGQGNSIRMEVSDYEFDELAGTVRKKISYPMDDIKRVLVLTESVELDALAKGDLDHVEEDVENALYENMENEVAGQVLEKEMGVDDSIIVGPEEIEQLRTFISGLEAEKPAKKAHILPLPPKNDE